MGVETIGSRGLRSVALLAGLCLVSCRSGGANLPGDESRIARGTLSGTVGGAEGSFPVAGRLVEAVNLKGGKRFPTKTNVDGHYTLLLPPGVYRIEVALGRGEVIVKQPREVEVKAGELLDNLDVTFGGAGVPRPPESH